MAVALAPKTQTFSVSTFIGRPVKRGEDAWLLVDQAIAKSGKEVTGFTVDEAKMTVTINYYSPDAEVQEPDLDELRAEEAYYKPLYV